MIHQRAARRREGHPRGPRNFTGGRVFVSARRSLPRPPNSIRPCLDPELSQQPSSPSRSAASRGPLRRSRSTPSRRGRRRLQGRFDRPRRRRPWNRAAGAARSRRPQGPARSARSLGRALRRRQLQGPHRRDTAGAEPFFPNDRGDAGSGGWEAVQWNFAGPYGVGAPQAWANAILAGRPGARGVTVAVLDTGVAYGNAAYKISPDFVRSQFVKGYDFVDHDPYPFDRTVTARTSPGRSRGDEQRHRPDGPGIRRADDAGARARQGGEGNAATSSRASAMRHGAARRSSTSASSSTPRSPPPTSRSCSTRSRSPSAAARS